VTDAHRLTGWRLAWCLLLLGCPDAASAQTVSHRGFVEGAAFTFPQTTGIDREHVVADVLARGELFVRPADWVRLTAGVEFRANSHDQVEDSWALRVQDRTRRRPHMTLRTASATLTRGPFTLDAGKQFIRWGKTDIVVPTDRFAPRDYLTVIDAPFLAVTGLRGVAQVHQVTIEGVWVPFLTPSRTPLLNQRWAGRAVDLAAVPVVEAPTAFPEGSQIGVRVGHVAKGLEYSASFYDGFNHLPGFRVSGPATADGPILVERHFPPIRTYGADAALPVPWFTIKGEAAAFTSSSPDADDYTLYVVQLERQQGEWVFVGGYAGEVVTARRAPLTFAPDRGLSRSIVARAAYTIDTNRSVEIETAVRQDGDGVYSKAAYSQARGPWRATITGVLLAGDAEDFIGQYDRNSYLNLTVRFSF
jgi:hypothetical protein